MFGTFASFRRQSLHGLTTALILNGMLASAAPPGWWTGNTLPVIDPGAAGENHGVVNIGQAKWVARNALEALREVLPGTAELVEADLVGPTKPIASWDAPATEEERVKQRAPLLIGQLKALAAPFYEHLYTVAPQWIASEKSLAGLPGPGGFPWTDVTTDDSNKSVALVGQLKAVFSLDFSADRETATDGLSDLLEWTVVNASGSDTWTNIGAIDASNIAQAATESGANVPVPSDRDRDGVLDMDDADPDDNVVDWKPSVGAFYTVVEMGQQDYSFYPYAFTPQPGVKPFLGNSPAFYASVGKEGSVLWSDLIPGSPIPEVWQERTRVWKNGVWSADLGSSSVAFGTISLETKYMFHYPDTNEAYLSAYLNREGNTTIPNARARAQGISGDTVVGIGRFEAYSDELPVAGTNGVVNEGEGESSAHGVALIWNKTGAVPAGWATTAVAPPTKGINYLFPAVMHGYADNEQHVNGRVVASSGGAMAALGGEMTYADRKWKVWVPPAAPGSGAPTWEMPYSDSSSYFVAEAIEDGGSVAGYRAYDAGASFYDAKLQVVESGAAQDLPGGAGWTAKVHALCRVNSEDTSRSRLVAAGTRLWVKKGGTWKESQRAPTVGPILAVAKDGVILGGSAIWRNGRAVPLDDLVKEVKSSGATPRYTNVRGYAMNGEGAIVAMADDALHPGTGKKTLMLLMPIRALGVDSSVTPAVVGDIASGVDSVSFTTPPNGVGYQTKPWIMVPNGTSNLVRFQTPASATSPWSFNSLANTTFNPTSLNAGDMAETISSTSGVTQNRDLVFTIGGAATNPSPVGIKAMKKRDLYVTVHPIVAHYVPANDPEKDSKKRRKYGPDDPPIYIPTEAEVESYLNRVFGKQVNVWFHATVKPPYIVEWDTMTTADFPSGGGKGVQYGDNYMEVAAIPTKEQEAVSKLEARAGDINVYLVGGAFMLRAHVSVPSLGFNKAFPAAGIADRDSKRVWIDSFYRYRYTYGYPAREIAMNALMNTMAHEIGHIIVQDGHPDEGSGPAPLGAEIKPSLLPNDFHDRRLMRSEFNPAKGHGKQLVKAEWDAVENWFILQGK